MSMPDFKVPKAAFDPGMYRMSLQKVDGCQVRVWTSDGVQTDEYQPGVMFEFTDLGSGKTFTQEAKASLHERSNVVKLAKQLAPALITPEILRDKVKFWKILKSCEGQEYLVSLSVNEKGTWNKIGAIIPASAGTAPALKPKQKPKQELASDDIPF